MYLNHLLLGLVLGLVDDQLDQIRDLRLRFNRNGECEAAEFIDHNKDILLTLWALRSHRANDIKVLSSVRPLCSRSRTRRMRYPLTFVQ